MPLFDRFITNNDIIASDLLGFLIIYITMSVFLALRLLYNPQQQKNNEKQNICNFRRNSKKVAKEYS